MNGGQLIQVARRIPSTFRQQHGTCEHRIRPIRGMIIQTAGSQTILSGRVGGGALGSVTAGGAALRGYMIVLSAAAFTIWTALLGRFPVGRVSLFGFLIPVFGAVFSALVLGENIMTVRNLLSLLLVSGGIALAYSAAASSKS